MRLWTAKEQDLEAVVMLYREMFTEQARVRPDFFRPGEPSSAYLRQLLESGKSDVLLAVEGKLPVGFAVVHARETPRLDCFVPRCYAILEDLFVSREYRGQGTGKALAQGAEDWSRARGLEFLELDVLTDNKTALGLYQAQGFQPFMMNLRRQL